jgi:hypothetical protein
MSGQDRVLSDTTWLRDVHDAQEGARAFRAAQHLDWPEQRTASDFFVTVARIWCITILLLVLGAVVAVIREKTETQYFSSPGSSQIYRPEK